MPQPFTAHRLDQLDAVLTKRIESAAWYDSKPTKRVLQDLSERAGHNLPFALPDVAAHVAAEPEPEHYVTWITLKGGEVKREPVGYCVDEDEALEEARRLASRKFPGLMSSITVMARAA